MWPKTSRRRGTKFEPQWAIKMNALCKAAEPQLNDIPASMATLDSAAVATQIASFTGSTSVLTINSAGTSDLAPPRNFSQWSQRVVAQAGAYTRVITLDTSKAVTGARFHVALEIAADSDAVVEFRNESAGGTLLQSIVGDDDHEQFMTAVFVFEDAAWVFDGYLR